MELKVYRVTNGSVIDDLPKSKWYMVGRSRGVVVRVRDVMNGEDGGVAREIASGCGISGAAILNVVLIPSWV